MRRHVETTLDPLILQSRGKRSRIYLVAALGVNPQRRGPRWRRNSRRLLSSFDPRRMLSVDSRALAGATLLAFVAGARSLRGQENYEIQVYGSETVPRGVTMFELHSNFTVNGSTLASAGGLSPTNHALHETVEITHGFND